MTCPFTDYAKIEKQNNISVNVFGYGDETEYHTIFPNKTLIKMLIYYYYWILKVFVMF